MCGSLLLCRWQYAIALRWVWHHRSCTLLSFADTNEEISPKSNKGDDSFEAYQPDCANFSTSFSLSQALKNAYLFASSHPLRHKPARDGDSCAINSPANDMRHVYGSVSILGVQRYGYRSCVPSGRGACVVGVHVAASIASADVLKVCTTRSYVRAVPATPRPGTRFGSRSDQLLFKTCGRVEVHGTPQSS